MPTGVFHVQHTTQQAAWRQWSRLVWSRWDPLVRTLEIKSVTRRKCNPWLPCTSQCSSYKQQHIQYVHRKCRVQKSRCSDNIVVWRCLSEPRCNLLLVSWGGAPGFWKEEAASWSMGAEPGWLSDGKRGEGEGEGTRVGESEWERGVLMDSSLKLQHDPDEWMDVCCGCQSSAHTRNIHHTGHACKLGKLAHQELGRMVVQTDTFSKALDIRRRQVGQTKCTGGEMCCIH